METIDLAFDAFGDEANRPLLILHGFFASSRNWRQLAGQLADQYRVYVVDLRNHGASGHHPIMDYFSMSADLLCFIKQRGLTNASLLGHSMGGKLAMWFALNHPGYVDNLLIADIAPVNYPHSFNQLIQSLQSLPLKGLTNRKQAEEWLAVEIPELSYRQFLLQNLILDNKEYRWRINLDIFRQSASHIAAFPDTHNVRPYSGKTLFLAGADSGYVKRGQIHHLFPTAELDFIPNAGHWLHVQQPSVFLSRVQAFLQAR